MPTINRCGGGGDAIKEPYDFPLSMQTAEPTPVNTNHIWIHNDVKRPLAIDEAIRAGGWNNDDRYYAIVDSTDNNFIQIEGPKTLTDGSHVPLNNRHQNRDDAPWHLGWTQYAKKNGLGYYSDNYSKWPRIYSRIGGVIDMEDAQRWDGSAWQWLSQKGKYVVLGCFTENNVFIYNRPTNTSLLPHDALPSLDLGSVFVVSWSLDGNYLVVCGNFHNYVSVYKRTGDAFTKLNITVPYKTGYIYDGSFSPDGNYLAICGVTSGSSGTPITEVYKKQTDESWAAIATDLFTTTSGTNKHIYGCRWTPDGSKLIISGRVNGVFWYQRNVDTFTQLPNPAVTIGASGHFDISSDGKYMVGTCDNSPYVFLYKITENSLINISFSDASFDSSSGYISDMAACFIPNSHRVILCVRTAVIDFYDVTDTSFTSVSGVSIPSGAHTVSISSDGTILCVGFLYSPYFRWYQIGDGLSSTPFLTELTSPSTMPTSVPQSIAIL